MTTPTHAKKLRADSKLAKLPPEARAELAARLRSQQETLDSICAWLSSAHGVSISPQAVSVYYRTRILPVSWRYSEECAEELNKVGSSGMAKAAHSALIQIIFEVVTRRGDVPTKELDKLGRLLISAMTVAQNERKLSLAERRAAALETVATQAAAGGLSPATLAAAEEALHLM